MDALNGVAIALSGLAFTGAALLTAGVAAPANAEVRISAPYVPSQGEKKEEGGERAEVGKGGEGQQRDVGSWQENNCIKSYCLNVVLSMPGI